VVLRRLAPDRPLLEAVTVALILLIDFSLFRQARSRFRRAHSMVAHSVADGTITSRVMNDRE
jgi:hypothetical protein